MLGRGAVLLRALSSRWGEGVSAMGLANNAGATQRRLVWLLGDHLSPHNPLLIGSSPQSVDVLMIEAPGEATEVWSHKARIALFLAAMRHRARALRELGYRVHYVSLNDWPDTPGLVERAARFLREGAPGVAAGAQNATPIQVPWDRLELLEAGEWRLQEAIEAMARAQGIAMRWHADPHFYCSREEFAAWAKGLKQWRMEFFYRKMRQRHGVLLEPAGSPVGGQWNFDVDNRQPYPKTGPGPIPQPLWFEPDAITQEVLTEVGQRFAEHPGSLDHFAWPVTPEQARAALEHFIAHRLGQFGPYQDAMWTGETWGWHALLSTSLNLKLLDPREVVQAAEAAWRTRGLDLASVEGFIRQVLGWREFIRGVYWMQMPGLRQANHYGHSRPLPRWYWTGQTHMACMREVVGQTLKHGFAHHIQRLMVTGQFALLAQLDPQAVEDWYLAVYVDAVEWVELPNVAGMALFADGGRFTSKPYIASGQYIKRQSNYCQGCRYDPALRTGPKACPVSTLYWAFLDRHEAALAKNPRTALMAKSVGKLDSEARQALRDWAGRVLENLDSL